MQDLLKDYQAFLEQKIELAPESGFLVSREKINPKATELQKDAVQWLLQGGRRACFANFGLGKTVMQLEYLRLVAEHTGKPTLITCPLGVKQEFTHDAVKLLGMEAPTYCPTMADVRRCDRPILLTNYERVRDGDIDPAYFSGCTLDEASCLRSYGSKTYQEFLHLYQSVPYRAVFTATPSPNQYKELIHYAGFLGIMDTGQALTRFFQRDSQKAGHLTLYPGQEQEFWAWLGSWALFLLKPSDLGYSDEGYALPPMEVRWHRLQTKQIGYTVDRDGQMGLPDLNARSSLQAAAKIKRESIDQRVEAAAQIVEASPEDHFILWHDLERERHAIKKRLPEASEVYGSQEMEEKESRVIAFAEGESRLLATKKSISGQGCNFQRHCHRAIFVGVDEKFNDFIQAIHRIYRYLQQDKVIIDIIYMDTEQYIVDDLKAKWKRHDALMERMSSLIRQKGLNNAKSVEALRRKMGVKRVEVKGKHYRCINNDSVEEMAQMGENSVDMILTSIPFGNQYEYSANYNDFGHNPDTAAFFEQMDYLSPNLLKALRPGRIFACHVKDRIRFGNVTGTGMPTVEPFHAICISHFIRHGFQYMGMITVVTDVVRENNQTYRLGWSEQCKDGTKMGVGMEEYVLLFRKLPSDTSTAYADIPVAKEKKEYTRARWQIDAHGYWRSSGDRLVSKEELLQTPVNKLQAVYRKYSRDTVYSFWEHCKLAQKLDEEGKLPATFMVVAPGSWNDRVWDDIVRMRTLNADQKRRNLTLHVCPLQIDLVERLIERYSNPGDVILDPFAGIGTVPKMAVKMHRTGIGIELSNDYFRDMVGYCQAEEAKIDTPTLFDLLDGVSRERRVL